MDNTYLTSAGSLVQPRLDANTPPIYDLDGLNLGAILDGVTVDQRVRGSWWQNSEYFFIYPFLSESSEGGREYIGLVGEGVSKSDEHARRMFRAVLHYLGCMPFTFENGEAGTYSVEEYQRRIREALEVPAEKCWRQFPPPPTPRTPPDEPTNPTDATPL